MNSRLEIHHLQPFSKYPELMKDRGNVICLCHECHKFYHKLYQGRENGATFAKFLRDYGTIMKR